MADTQSTPPVQGSLPLYKKPVPLNPSAHKGMGLRYTDRPFDFIATTHFFPLTLGEFGKAAGRYPIIFIGESKIPAAALGLRAGENLFVDPETGLFEQNGYVPAFVRRYPFVSAAHGGDSDQFTICIDEESHLISDKPEQPFFDDKGEPTAFTQQAIEFVRRYEFDAKNTTQFITAMEELDLFDEQEAQFQPRDAQGQPVGELQTLAKYVAFSPDKFRALDASKLAELRDNTYLGAIYAQMLSMAMWDELFSRAAARNANGQQPQSSAQPGDLSSPPPPPEV